MKCNFLGSFHGKEFVLQAFSHPELNGNLGGRSKDIASRPPRLALVVRNNYWQPALGWRSCSHVIFPALHLSKSLSL